MRYPHQELAANPHDRIAIHRKDDAWLERQWQQDNSRVVVLAGTRVRPVGGAIGWCASGEAPEGLRVLLGDRDGVTSWAVLADPSAVEGPREEWLPLRAVLAMLADAATIQDAPQLLHAVGLAEWHWNTRCCPRCGGRLISQAAGHELQCQACGRTQFPRTDPAVIMSVTHGEPGSEEERILLGRQGSWPEGRFSTLAGFCEPGESAEDSVRREVLEETGIVVGDVEYVGSQGWPFPASMMLGFTGRAVTDTIEVDNDELAEARWWTRAQMRQEAEAGELVLPGGVSISRSLVERWYGPGARLPGSW